MPAKKTMTRTTPDGMVNSQNINRMVKEYVDTKKMFDTTKARVDKLKTDLRTYLEQRGERDEKGHTWMPIDGVDGVSSLKLERRVSVAMDHAKAEKWLKANGLWEECSDEIPAHRELSEDKVLALGFDGKIPKRVADGFTVRSESFAFKTV